MAEGRLEGVNMEFEGGETAFEVRCEPYDTRPFRGVSGRTWARFRLLGDYEATFEWKTGADHVRALCRKVKARRIPRRVALVDDVLAEYLERRIEAARHSDDKREPDVIMDETIYEVATGIIKVAGFDTNGCYYDCEGDAHLSDAAAALPLPPWGRVQMSSGGGPGSGYDQPLVVLAPERTLRDLAKWLRTSG